MLSRTTALLRRFAALLNHQTYMLSRTTALLRRFAALRNHQTCMFSRQTALRRRFVNLVWSKEGLVFGNPSPNSARS